MDPRDSSVTSVKAPGVVATQACLDRIREQEHAMCLLCGPSNPNGLKVNFRVQPDGSVAAMFDCLPLLQSYRFAMVRAWTESDAAHPLYHQRAELLQDGKVVAEAKAKFIVRAAV